MTVLDIDADRMGRLLLKLEADAHRGGWDAPANMFVLYDSRDVATDQAYRQMMGRFAGPPSRLGPYAAHGAVPPGSLDGYPQHALFRLALYLSGSDHPHVAALVGMLRQPGFLGVAFQHEGWVREARDDAERESWGKQRFADMPGSREYRMVHAVDIGGGYHAARRVRGEKPDLLPGDATVEGAVVESLRMVVAVVADLPRPALTTTPSMWSWEDQQHAPEEGS